MATFGGQSTTIVGTAVILPGLGLGGAPYSYTGELKAPIDGTLTVNIKVDSGKGLTGQGELNISAAGTLNLSGSKIALKA